MSEPDPTAEPPAPTVGDIVELTIGAIAHGGHCVARLGDQAHGRVVFVRHALPGERARVRITDVGSGSFLRGDAVAVLRASPLRVPAPCPHAGPARCGGCDFQHVSPAGQRELKATVVREQFQRLAHVDVECPVEELPGGPLGWRTRVLYAVGEQGQVGLRQHRSHALEPLSSCPLGVEAVATASQLTQSWPGLSGLELVAAGPPGEEIAAEVTVLAHRPGRPARPNRVGRSPGRQGGRTQRRGPDRVELETGPTRIRHRVLGRDFVVAAGGFWQVHPAAAPRFVTDVLDALEPEPGERVLDLYAGAGLFTAFLADAVGVTGEVIGVESDPQAVRDAQDNLLDVPQAAMYAGRVTADMVAGYGPTCDLVVLDPPRSGVGRDVVLAVLDLAPRAVAYLACDPASLARDVATALEAGWQLASLRAYDAFPMTHHIETLAVLRPPVPSPVTSLP